MIIDLTELGRGSKQSVHIKLFERELAILDQIAAENECSRAAAVGALLRRFDGVNFEDALAGSKDGRRKTRVGAK